MFCNDVEGSLLSMFCCLWSGVCFKKRITRVVRENQELKIVSCYSLICLPREPAELISPGGQTGLSAVGLIQRGPVIIISLVSSQISEPERKN